jgi:ubiquinone/menaquinone biosynthesis C-methylase UbiE
MKERRLKSNFAFRLMSLKFRLRDLIRPPLTILQESGLNPGMAVLDFGCGPGSFSVAAARVVGPEGCVYALDIHPLALRSVRRAAARLRLDNLVAISASNLAELDAGCIDVVLLYDVLHHIPDQPSTLADIHRVLKVGGILSVSDHHLRPEVLGTAVTAGGLFRPDGRGRWTFRFARVPAGEEGA